MTVVRARKGKSSRVSLARAYVLANAPQFASTIYGMVPVAVENLTDKIGGPMGITDKLVWYYDPEWVDKEEEDIVAAALGHEVIHDQLQHQVRGISYADKRLFNVAADYVVNVAQRNMIRAHNVIKEGKWVVEEKAVWRLPEWVMFPEQQSLPPGLTVDQYYNLLLKKKHKEEKDREEKGEKKAGEKGEPSAGKQAEGNNPLPPPKIMAGGCGGIAGNKNSIEEQLNKEHGRTEGECAGIRRKTTEAIKKYIESQDNILKRGTDPGIFEQVIERLDGRALVPWHVKLANLIRHTTGRVSSGGMDYSMAKPSKRSLAMGIPKSGVVKREIVILIVLDTSGSISKRDLGIALRESSGVLCAAGIPAAYLMQVDAAAQTKPTLTTSKSLRELKALGRGGTDFRPAFEVANKMYPRPGLIIYMTDGYGTYPEHPLPGVHTIWCMITRSYSKPPWGMMVEVGADTEI